MKKIEKHFKNKPYLHNSFFLDNTFNKIKNGIKENYYESILNKIKTINNTSLEIPMDYKKNEIDLNVNISKISKDLIYKIFNTYLKQDILHKKKGDIEGFAKELRNSYAKADETFFGWCQDEKEVLPSSIIHHEIDKQCKNYNIAIPNESKRSIFFYIANRADIKLNNGAAQSTIIQQLVDIPDVVEAVNKLGISNDCHLKYDFYCFLAENIYNDLLKNEQKVNFFKIKDAIKIIIEKKAQEENNKTKDNIFYPKYAFNL